MKKTICAIALGLASTTAFSAETGTIHFYGEIESGTCPIQIIDPRNGNDMSQVDMGNVNVAAFDNIGDEAAIRPFSMRITPGGACDLSGGKDATVTLSGNYGGEGASGELFALAPGGAGGVALAIKDRSNNLVGNGKTVGPYSLKEDVPTDILFSALYKSTATTVNAGSANTDISFVVDIK